MPFARAKTPDDIDGVSVVPTLLRRGQQRTHEFLHWESAKEARSKRSAWARATGRRCKLGGPLELYDLAKDLGEAKNIAERHPDVTARIEAYLQTARTDSTDWFLPPCAERAQIGAGSASILRRPGTVQRVTEPGS